MSEKTNRNLVGIIVVLSLFMVHANTVLVQSQDQNQLEKLLVLVTEISPTHPLLIEMQLDPVETQQSLILSKSGFGWEIQSKELIASFKGPDISFSYSEQMGTIEFKVLSGDPGISTILIKGVDADREGLPITTSEISFKGSTIKGSFLTQILSPNHLLITQ